VPTRFVLGTADRFFPPEFMRRVVPAGWASFPTRSPPGTPPRSAAPKELAGLLASYAATSR
jgi:hypothetical protein